MTTMLDTLRAVRLLGVELEFKPGRRDEREGLPDRIYDDYVISYRGVTETMALQQAIDRYTLHYHVLGRALELKERVDREHNLASNT